jgi:hypothetical protein
MRPDLPPERSARDTIGSIISEDGEGINWKEKTMKNEKRNV